MPTSADTSTETSQSADRCAPEKLWTRQFVVGTLTNFVFALNYFMLMVIMTAYALDHYDAPAPAAAFCASIFIIGTLFARFTSAPLMKKVGKRMLLIIGSSCLVAFTALYLFNIPFVLLFVVRFCHGYSYGTCSTTIATIVTGIVPKHRKGEGIGYYMLSVTLGSAIGPFVGVFVSRNVSYETLFFLSLCVALLTISCALILQGKRRPAKDVSAQSEVIETTEEIAAIISDAPKEEAKELRAAQEQARLQAQGEDTDRTSLQQASSEHDRGDTKRRSFASFIEPFFEVSVVPISLVCGIIFFGYSSYLTFLTPYSIEIGLSRAASVFFVVYALAMFITRPFTGRAFDRRGPNIVMIPAFFSFSAGMLVLAFASNDWMILGAAALLGFGVGTIQSCGLSLAVRIADDDRLSVANATFYVMIDIGVGIGPLVLGCIVPFIGYSNMFIAMAAVGMFAFVLFLFVVRRKKKKVA